MKKHSYVKYLRQFKFHSLLARSVVLILSITLVTNLALGLLSYLRTNSRLVEEVRNTNQEALNRVERVFSTHMSGAVYGLIHLGTNYDAVRLATNYDSQSLFTSYRMIERLSTLMDMIVDNNPFIHSVYVYLADSGMIISPQETSAVSYFYDLGWIELYSRLMRQSSRPKFSYELMYRDVFISSGKSIPGMSLVATLPLTNDSPSGCVVVNVSLQAMQEAAGNEMIRPMDFLAVYDEEGREIAACGEDPGINSTEVTIAGSLNRWRYTARTERGTFTLYVGSLGRYLLLTVILCIAAGFLLTGLVATWLYRPFLRLHERLEAGGADWHSAQDEAEYIQQGVGRAIARNNEYHRLIRDNYEFLKGNFLRNILKGTGRYRSLNLIRERASFYHIETDFSLPVGLLLASMDPDTPFGGFDSSDEQFEISKLKVLHDIAERLPQVDVFDYGAYDIAVLFNFGDNHRETSVRYGRMCLDCIRETAGLEASILIAPGPGFYENLVDLAKKMDRLRRFRFAVDPGRIILYEDFDFTCSPGNDEVDGCRERVLYYLHAGELENCEAAFKDLLRCIENSDFSRRRRDNALVQLIANVELEAREAGIEDQDLYTRLKAMANVTGVSADLSLAEIQFHYVFEHMCRIIRYRRFEHKEDVVRRAVDFITANYSRDISLEDVAVSVDLSAPYLSKVFGEIKGEGFKEFISRLRIERAVILLQTGDIPIREIYRQLGFTNVSTFYRVFKKYVGRTPDSLRKEARAPDIRAEL